MIPIVSLIGSSSSGKTTLLEKLVVELKKDGLRVAVIKHAHNGDISFDKEGKNSHRLATAGAEEVIVSGPQEIVFMKKTDHDLSPGEISRFIGSEIDLILTEGFKDADTLKIELHRKALNTELLAKPEQLLAVVTDEQLNIQAPQFDAMKDNTIEIANLIEKWLSHQHQRENALVVNKELDEPDPFAQDNTRTLEGILSSLSA
jgi:molybdopterin-guanine dinucleotide biosynthesis protein B